jgi:multidrug efflux pump subunit AcrA (membrane-fusion protein)
MRTNESTKVPARAAAGCALALAAAVGLAGCRDVHGEAPAAPRPVKVSDVRVPGGPAAVRYSASIVPSEQIVLAFKTSGYVDQVLQRHGADGRIRALQAGDPVPAGAVLARVREADYRERVNQATGSLGELEAAQAKATLDLDRARALFAAQALTKPELDAAQAAYDANLARMAAAHAQIETARLTLTDTALVAPRSGVIIERKVEAGSRRFAGRRSRAASPRSRRRPTRRAACLTSRSPSPTATAACGRA